MQNRFRFIYKKMVDKKMTSGFKVEEEYVHIFFKLLYCSEPRKDIFNLLDVTKVYWL